MSSVPSIPVNTQILQRRKARSNDAYAVRVGMTNASLFAYVADRQERPARPCKLTSPRTARKVCVGFSPEPVPELIATFQD